VNGTHQPLAYADNVNLLVDDMDTINRNTEIVIDASKGVDIEVNIEKTKYMLVSHNQNADQNRNIKIGNRSFENVSQFKYLGMTVTIQNVIQKENKRILNSGHACYNSAQNLPSSCLPLKTIEVGIYNTMILPLVLYGSDIKGGS
jgi:hypothetical protein